MTALAGGELNLLGTDLETHPWEEAVPTLSLVNLDEVTLHNNEADMGAARLRDQFMGLIATAGVMLGESTLGVRNPNSQYFSASLVRDKEAPGAPPQLHLAWDLRDPNPEKYEQALSWKGQEVIEKRLIEVLPEGTSVDVCVALLACMRSEFVDYKPDLQSRPTNGKFPADGRHAMQGDWGFERVVRYKAPLASRLELDLANVQAMGIRLSETSHRKEVMWTYGEGGDFQRSGDSESTSSSRTLSVGDICVLLELAQNILRNDGNVANISKS
jgi:hypothetical protein